MRKSLVLPKCVRLWTHCFPRETNLLVFGRVFNAKSISCRLSEEPASVDQHVANLHWQRRSSRPKTPGFDLLQVRVRGQRPQGTEYLFSLPSLCRCRRPHRSCSRPLATSTGRLPGGSRYQPGSSISTLTRSEGPGLGIYPSLCPLSGPPSQLMMQLKGFSSGSSMRSVPWARPLFVVSNKGTCRRSEEARRAAIDRNQVHQRGVGCFSSGTDKDAQQAGSSSSVGKSGPNSAF